MSRGLKTSQQRIDAVLRVISLMCIITGGVFAYFIATTSGLIPQLVPIFYFIAAFLILVGFIVLISKYD